MKTPEEYIIDTSVLIALSHLNKLDLLCRLYNKVLITNAVQSEFDDHLPSCCVLINTNNQSIDSFQKEANLGSGEASVIVYSLMLKKEITCFIDEQRARKIAKKHGLRVSGTIGILLKMEEKGLIQSAYDDVLTLKNKGFYISNQILENLKNKPASN